MRERCVSIARFPALSLVYRLGYLLREYYHVLPDSQPNIIQAFCKQPDLIFYY